MQGEALPPLIFSLHVFENDLETDLMHNCHSIQLNEMNLFLLIYVDDTVLLAENRENSQEIMDALLQWTRKYGLTVNVEKTKVMIFSSSWQLGNETFYYNGKLVEIVNTFSYLGILLNYI